MNKKRRGRSKSGFCALRRGLDVREEEEEEEEELQDPW